MDHATKLRLERLERTIAVLGETIMAKLDDLTAQLNDAVSALAARLDAQKSAPAPAPSGDVVTDAQLAALSGVLDHLKAMVAPSTPAGAAGAPAPAQPAAAAGGAPAPAQPAPAAPAPAPPAAAPAPGAVSHDGETITAPVEHLSPAAAPSASS